MKRKKFPLLTLALLLAGCGGAIGPSLSIMSMGQPIWDDSTRTLYFNFQVVTLPGTSVQEVSARVEGPISAPVSLTPLGNNTWTGSVYLPTDGTYKVYVKAKDSLGTAKEVLLFQKEITSGGGGGDNPPPPPWTLFSY